VLAAYRQTADLWGALGSDALLWGLSAKDLQQGVAPVVAPLYPAMVALLEGSGLPLVLAGQGLAMVCVALIPALLWCLARGAGASRAVSLLAALAALALPDVARWAQQLQPDALAALLLLAAAGLLQRAWAGSKPAAWAAAVLVGLAPLVRMHGLALVPVALLVLVLRGQGRQRWGPPLLLLAVWWCGPLLVGMLPGPHPLAAPWFDRPASAVSVLQARDTQLVSYMPRLEGAHQQAYAQLLHEGDRMGQLVWHALRSLRLAWDLWALLALAGAAALLARRRALLALAAPLLCAAPALVVFSERRHVALLVPVALLVLAVAVGRLAFGARSALALALAGLLGWTLCGWPAAQEDLQTQSRRARRMAALAQEVADLEPPVRLYAGGRSDLALYLPLPLHRLDGSAADWHSAFLSWRPPRRQDWQLVLEGRDAVNVYQLKPDEPDRPCPRGRPAPGSPYLQLPQGGARLVRCGREKRR